MRLLYFLFAPILWPFAQLLRLRMIVRNFYYEQGILAPYTSSIPIICVGNLVFGGAGKTPHVRYCADILSPKQPQGTLWLLSRGYKRKSRGLSVFAPEHGPEKLGDEAFWLATTTGLPLLVDRNRVRAVKYLETRKPTPTLILMDDGFQHRALKASCYLLLITYADASFTKSLVSLKCFRESMRGMRRAQVIVITRCPPILEPTKKVALLRVSRYFTARTRFLSTSSGKPVVVASQKASSPNFSGPCSGANTDKPRDLRL